MRCSALLMALAAFLGASAGDATSIARMLPHNPALARGAIEEFFGLVDESNADEVSGRYLIFTDDFGHVLGDELDAFLTKMNAPEGHADTQPIRIGRLRRLLDHRYTPIYLVEIHRTRWFPEQLDMLSMAMEPAGYREATEFWLIHFQSDRVFYVREAWQMWQLIDPSLIPADQRL
jgi:hypothetical protein